MVINYLFSVKPSLSILAINKTVVAHFAWSSKKNNFVDSKFQVIHEDNLFTGLLDAANCDTIFNLRLEDLLKVCWDV